MKDITGQKFGRLTAVRFSHMHKFPSGKRHRKWEFLCDCGKSTTALVSLVTQGHTNSCGCYQSQRRIESHTKHGGAKNKEPLYIVWCGMKQRCEDPGYKFYDRWGGRGIRIEWKSYEEFRSDMLPSYLPGLEIERMDNNGPYEKSNCRWATPGDQSRNRRSNVTITFHGIIMCRAEWARCFGLNPTTLERRLKSGWTMEQSLTTPLLGCTT